MADTKTTALAELSARPASNDVVAIVDVSDIAMAASGTTKRIQFSNLGSDLLSTLLQSEISVTGATTATIGRMHVCSGTSADYTVILPAASGNAGKLLGFRMANALTKLVTIDGSASELIDGALTRVMWANETAILLCDGTGWIKIAGKTIPMQCLLVRNTAQSIPTGTPATQTQLDVSVYDIGALGNTSTYRITLKRAGIWYLFAAHEMANLPADKYAAVEIRINGTFAYYSYGFCPVPSSIVTNFGMLHVATVGDYVEIFFEQNSGSALNTSTTGWGKPMLGVHEQPQW